jgi:hypothetical protein
VNPTRTTELIIGSIEATALAVWVAYTSDIPFALAFPFFVVCRPVAALAGDAVAKRYNPMQTAAERPRVATIAARIIVLPSMAALLTAIWVWWTRSTFLPAYSYCLIACAAFGAVHGIIMEWEDHQPGGWLNPKVER